MIGHWIETFVLAFTLVLARTSTFVLTLPLFGGASVPRTVRVGLAFALTLFWVTVLGPTPADNFRQLPGHTHWLAFVLALFREIIVGGAMGVAFGLFFLPFRIAGEFIGQEMGMTTAQITDPTNNQRNTIVAQAFEMLGMAMFFGLDGHHIFLSMLHSSFLRRPIGGAFVELPVSQYVAAVSMTQEWGLLLAAPVICCLFLTSIVLAFMARAAPQLSLMSIGFSLRLFVGMLASFILLPEIAGSMSRVIGRFSELLYGM